MRKHKRIIEENSFKIGSCVRYVGNRGRDVFIDDNFTPIPLTLNKVYIITSIYGNNIIVTDDNGNPVNGHGIHKDRFILI